jgi:Fur family ferric uptake transcriptional regulator
MHEHPDEPMGRIEKACVDKGMRMTGQRRVIARVLSDAHDHPDVEELHRRAVKVDPRISIATVYRTVRLFQEAGILARHDFGDGRARYEEVPEAHHDHLIDTRTGRVIEFHDDEIEELQRKIAAKLGYRLVDHRLELYGVPLKPDKEK